MQLMAMIATERLEELIILMNYLMKKRVFLIGESDYLTSD
jgi:hypothetical protein